MSTAFAIAAVSKVLRELLTDALGDGSLTTFLGVSDVPVSALPPDRISVDNTNEPNQLNVFMYQVSPNLGWRNVGLPSHDDQGRRVQNPPLALDLHYLLSAYGTGDLHHDAILGYVGQFLHENPVPTRDVIRTALAVDGTGDPKIPDPSLADQFEQIKIVPEYLSSEELSKLWTAFQAKYRPSVAYRVSVVLIEGKQPGRSPLPVLTRGDWIPALGRDAGVIAQPSLASPYPTIVELLPPDNQPSVRLGETLTIRGSHLTGDTVEVVCEHMRYGKRGVLTPDGPSDSEITVQLPNGPADWPAGTYVLSVTVTVGDKVRTTNKLPFALVPEADPPVEGEPNPKAVRSSDNSVQITIRLGPYVQPEQDANLIVGDIGVVSYTTPLPGKLVFEAGDLPPGACYYRLRVDGVESILVDQSKMPPAFRDDQQVTIPPRVTS